MPGLEKLKEDVSSPIVHNGGGSLFDLSGSYSSFRDENDDSTKKSVLASSEYKLFSSSPSKMKKEQQQKRNNQMSKSFDTMTADFGDGGDNNDDDIKATAIKNGKKTLPKPFAKKQKSSSSSLNNSATLKHGDATKTTNGDAKMSFKKKSTMNGKNKDDPFRFAGDGVDFKCKLIGFQEVDQPRGDQMCQEAIQTCKAIVKRKGEHKQRIVFNISLEGLKIKDSVSGMVLHSFPVSKVSFIAKDATDNRAFGFIYGVTDHEHHFYAVKTEKTADFVVFSIRDMFQIVYEMKKKQVEQAKQSQTQKNGLEMIKNKSIGNDEDHTSPTNDSQSPEANLLDLETELENLEQGMQNMNKWVFMPEDGNNTATVVNGTNNQFSSSDTTSSTWATASLSSSALTELNNDPFADNMFTSSMNSFTSSAGNSVAKETFVSPPPSTNGHSRRSSSGAAAHHNSTVAVRSTLFGPSQQNTNGGDPFAVFDFPNENRAPTSTTAAGEAVYLASPPRVVADPFDTSHVMNVLATVNNGNAHSVYTPVMNKGLASTLRPPPAAAFFDAMTPQVSSTPVAAAPSSIKNHAVWSNSLADVATPPTLTKSAARKSAADDLFASYGDADGATDDHRRFPSVIVPPPQQHHLQNGYNLTQPSPLASSDDFSPDRSVFSGGEQQTNYASICTSTSNSALMNNAMNDTNALRLSFLNSDHHVSSIDWSSNQKSLANKNLHNSSETMNGQNHVMHSAKSASSLNPFSNVSNFDRSSPVIGHGFASSTNYEYNYSNNNSDYRFSSPPTKVDPFAHLRQKPKTINELRVEKMTNGSASLDQLESLMNGKHTNAAPSIPRRNSPVGPNRPTPPPTVVRPQNDSTLSGGFLPPPPKNERGGAAAFSKKTDPFNDDFFVRH